MQSVGGRSLYLDERKWLVLSGWDARIIGLLYSLFTDDGVDGRLQTRLKHQTVRLAPSDLF